MLKSLHSGCYLPKLLAVKAGNSQKCRSCSHPGGGTARDTTSSKRPSRPGSGWKRTVAAATSTGAPDPSSTANTPRDWEAVKSPEGLPFDRRWQKGGGLVGFHTSDHQGLSRGHYVVTNTNNRIINLGKR